MNQVKIFDTTLRDGEQAPGCSMNLREKIEVAKCLEKMKVDKVDKDIRTDLVLIHSLCLLSVDRRSEAVTCFSRL